MIIKNFPDLIKAYEDEWKTEYLDSIISIKIVADVNDAIKHITKYGSNHTESINTENKENIIRFKIKLKFPFFNSLSFLTYLEKSPKFRITIEK